MLYAETADLVKKTYTVNELGDSIATETTRTVFVDVQSIGLKRKIEALAAGLKLEYKFTLSNELEYEGEDTLIYRTVRYSVISVFVKDSREIELTTTRQIQ